MSTMSNRKGKGAAEPPSTGAGSFRDLLRVRAGSKVSLADVDANATFGYERAAASTKVDHDTERLSSLQDRIWAERKRRVLVVLQGIDTAGKDGAIRHVMASFNPQGSRVVAFGVPTALELAHDYLWRVHAAVPGDGEIVIFNRSHYESVLVERVRRLVPEEVWLRRYDQINAFEELLSSEGTTIVKFFLAIDRDEQLERLRARYSDPTKRWKFKLGDLEERERWDDYIAAFEDALERCSTDIAPWYVVPANRKWFRNLAIDEILADVLEELKPDYPPGDDLPADLVIK